MRARREPSMIFGSARSPGVIDWMIAWMRSISRSSKFAELVAELTHPGQHPQDLATASPSCGSACICSRKSSRVKSPPCPVSLRGRLGGLVGVERLLGLLDQGEHVAHVEDARGHPVGVEHVEVGELLARSTRT